MTLLRPKLIFLLGACFSITSGDAFSVKTPQKSSSGTGFGAPKVSKEYDVDESPEIAKLIQFLSSHPSMKADIANIEVGKSRTTGMRSLYATKKISKEKIICKIPSDFALALSDPAKGGKDAPTVAHGGANYIQMYCQDAKAKQEWSPYLDTLPTEVGEAVTPDFFSDEEIALLEFPRIVERARQRKQELQEVATEKGIDIKELQFAAWLIGSRAFPLSIAEDDERAGTEAGEIKYDDRGQVISKAERKWIRVLVPLLDIANHSSQNPNAKLTVLDPEKDDAWFALEATRPIKAGQEITLAYGSGVDSSIELLLNYGFVADRNPIDEFMLKKGGEDCIKSLEDWTTTVEEDKKMLEMTSPDSADDINLRKILQFRIKLKESYPENK